MSEDVIIPPQVQVPNTYPDFFALDVSFETLQKVYDDTRKEWEQTMVEFEYYKYRNVQGLFTPSLKKSKDKLEILQNYLQFLEQGLFQVSQALMPSVDEELEDESQNAILEEIEETTS